MIRERGFFFSLDSKNMALGWVRDTSMRLYKEMPLGVLLHNLLFFFLSLFKLSPINIPI